MNDQLAWQYALHRDDWVLPSGLCTANGSDLAQRFGIHRNNLLSACTQALADTFPVSQALVGEAFFASLALAYAKSHLPRSRRLAFYGHGFAGFVRQFPPAQSLPFLADLADLEMARVQAYHAADADHVSAQAMQAAMHAGGDLSTWRFSLHPSLQLIASPMAVLSLWQAHQHQADERDAWLAQMAIQQPECAAVFRSDDEVLCLPLPAADLALLRGLRAGLPLGEAITQAPADADLTQTLALLLQHQLISQWIQPPPEVSPP